jgi:DNA repair protein RadC
MLEKAGTIHNIPKRTDLLKQYSIGNGHLAAFQASLELASRAQAQIDKRQRINPKTSGEDVANYFGRLQSLTHEELWVMYLDDEGRIMDCTMETKGDENSTAMPINLIARKCILSGASAIIVIHNHPTGLARPSGVVGWWGDKAAFRQLYLLLKAIRIKFYDFVIVGDSSYWSGKENGDLDREIKQIEDEEYKKARGHQSQTQGMIDLLGV